MFVNELFSKKKPEPEKPRNFVAKNAKMGGAGAHKDKKKADKQGDVKHKKDLANLDESNRGYEPGFASPTAPSLKGRREFDEPDAVNNIEISINGRPWKVFAGKGLDSSPEFFKQKQSIDAMCKRKTAETGKKWSWGVTGAPATNEAKMATQDKENRFKAIKQRDQQQDQITHQAMNNINDEAEESINEFAPSSGDDGDDGFSDETLKRMAAQWYQGDEDPRIEKTLMAAGWEIGQDEGYDDEPGVFVVQSGDVNGNSYMSWPAHELQGVAEGLPQTLRKVVPGYARREIDRKMDAEKFGRTDVDRDANYYRYKKIQDKLKGQGVAEATGDPKFDKMLKSITGKRAVAKQQKADTKQQARDAFGSMFGGGNPADKLTIRKKGVAEGMKAHELSQYCEELVAEKGWDAAYKHASFMAQGATDPAWGSVLKYLKAMKDGVSEVAPPGAKAERMVKHIKKGYAKDGKLSDKERSIAYATAWKAHNKEINEEIEIRIIEMRMNGYEL